MIGNRRPSSPAGDSSSESGQRASLSAVPAVPSADHPRFGSINDVLPLGILVTDADGSCTYGNAAYQRLSGQRVADLLGSHWSAQIHPEDRERVLNGWHQAVRGQRPFVFEARLMRPDGEMVWTRRNVVQLDATGKTGYAHTVEDISAAKSAELERRAAEEALIEENERARVTLDSIGDAVMSTDTLGNITYMNVVAEDMTGWPRDEAIGQPLADIFRVVDATTRKPAVNPAQRAIDNDCVVDLAANCALLRRNGDDLEIEDSAAPIHNRAGAVTGAVIVFRDAKFSHATTMKMAHLAAHDLLTGLANRTVLAERLPLALKLARRHHKRVGLLFIDLDNFKQVNDTLGHECGDQLLTAVSRQLVEAVRTSDTVCRYGGDEFVVLLSEIEHTEHAALVARKLRAAVSVPRLIGAHEVSLMLSIGISVYPDHGDDPDTLLRKADAAMYEAKGSGRIAVAHQRNP